MRTCSQCHKRLLSARELRNAQTFVMFGVKRYLKLPKSLVLEHGRNNSVTNLDGDASVTINATVTRLLSIFHIFIVVILRRLRTVERSHQKLRLFVTDLIDAFLHD